VIIELYNRDKNQVISVNDPRGEFVEKELNRRADEHSLMKDEPEYIKISVADRLYLRTYVPIRASDHTIVGYFEGVYGVKPEAMVAIRERILFSLLQVMIVIFVTTVALYPIILGLTKSLVRYSVDLSKANIGMLKILGGAIAKRDGDTNRHNYRVSIYAIRLAEHVGLGTEEIQGIIKGAFLHDIGKIAISDRILLKPGKLDDNEFEVMKTHVEHGVDIIGEYAWLKNAMNIVRCHHERFDGNGYMAGLKGDDIPLSARIFSIADYFDALTSTRPYRETLPLEEAIRILSGIRGTHFDPVLLDAFLTIVRDLHAEISDADEKRLEGILSRMIGKYFNGK
jgi:putative nucleotidyltransferase with HDIG domain